MLTLWLVMFADVSVLRKTILDLRRREKQLLKNKEQSEIEFGQRRAKFKELYMAREGEKLLNTFVYSFLFSEDIYSLLTIKGQLCNV